MGPGPPGNRNAKAMSLSGIDPKHYSKHSFRIRAETTAAAGSARFPHQNPEQMGKRSLQVIHPNAKVETMCSGIKADFQLSSVRVH